MSVTLNFLGKLSDEDIVLQHPGAMTTILIISSRHACFEIPPHHAVVLLLC
jgi:hypothetical protein